MYQWISIGSDKSDPVSGKPYSLKKRYHVIKTIFDQVLEGVGQVHLCGVAHRDLKPENFLIELKDGEYTVKLTDFGLATTDSESDEFDCGSKPYMSFGKLLDPCTLKEIAQMHVLICFSVSSKESHVLSAPSM